MVYYLKGLHMREFGFPRLNKVTTEVGGVGSNSNKPFKWKKTNFVTDLPKHTPTACYLVAKTQNQPD